MGTAESANAIVDLMRAATVRPLLIAIDGQSAAGTTTLAAVLAPMLGATVIHGDDFYRDMPEDVRWALDPAQGVEQYFDWQRMRREVLEPLKLKHVCSFRPYSWLPEGGLSEETIVAEAADVVVVEGIYTARPEFADLIDLAVLVDTPTAERHRRLVARSHGNDKWWSRWEAAEDHYLTVIRPPASFDLVVAGT